MTDKISPARRSQNMSRIRSVNTKPEFTVRRVAHGLGYRFRLHRKDLPGRPDLVFPRLKAIVFVHGCFWHQHEASDCLDGRLPKSRPDYWLPKLRRNVERDAQAIARLENDGWRVLVVWECETRDQQKLRQILASFLSRLRS